MRETALEFESIGTISYRVSSTQSDNFLLFVPDSDHLLTYSGNPYAVFVGTHRREGSKRIEVQDAIAVRLRKTHDHGSYCKELIRINVVHDRFWKVVLRAAEQQSKVTVTVVKNQDDSLNLSAITFPAA